MQIGLTVAGIQVPPLAFLGMVIPGNRAAALRATPLRSCRLLNPNVHPIGRHIQAHFTNAPGWTQSQKGCVQLGVFHLGLLSPPRMSQDNTDAFGSRLTRRSSPPQDGSQPVKRRRALLASNPLRNNRSETHRNDEGAITVAPLPHHCDRFPMPQKTHRGTRRQPSRLESPTPLTHPKLNLLPNLLPIGVTHSKPGRTKNNLSHPSHPSHLSHRNVIGSILLYQLRPARGAA